jgi:probable HAF family extracellular repeat protein
VTACLLGCVAGTARAADAPPVFDLGKLDGSFASYSLAITTSGRVIGHSVYKRADIYNPEYTRAFSWTATEGMVDLGTLGGDFAVVNAVSPSGQVVGWSTRSGTYPARAFSWTPQGGMIDLGDLGGRTSVALTVSSAGHVVGQSTTTAGEQHAFLWTESDGMVDLGTLGGDYSRPSAVNAAGQVVGESPTSNGRQHAFSWTASGGMIDLDDPDGDSISTAIGVNAAGVVVGLRTVFEPSSFSNAAFSWTASGDRIDLEPLTDGGHSQATGVSANGLVIGRASAAVGSHAFAWKPPAQAVAITLGGTYSEPAAVNGTDQVVGQADTTGNHGRHAFSWTAAGGTIDLGTLGGTYSFATALNDAGQVVGVSSVAGDSGQRAFSWTQAGGTLELPTLGGRDSSAIAVNQRGQIAGSSQTAGIDPETHAVLWSAPQSLVGGLMEAIQELLDAGVINGGNANALISKLEGAIAQLDKGNVDPAVNKIEAFINEVEALIRSGRLTSEQGQPLIDTARLIIESLSR